MDHFCQEDLFLSRKTFLVKIKTMNIHHIFKRLLFLIAYAAMTLLMLDLYLHAFDPYVEDSIGLGSFCVASSILVFLSYRFITINDRKIGLLNNPQKV